jgi:hypothetical protein
MVALLIIPISIIEVKVSSIFKDIDIIRFKDFYDGVK